MLRMLSLCTGIGGFDLAASWTGGIEIIGQVEIDPYCQQVLSRQYPHIKRWGDIRTLQGDEHAFEEGIDIITAGFPCQPFSFAGKRAGRADDRNLWPDIRSILHTIRPGWFVGENVPGLLVIEKGEVFGEIISDLVKMGYRVAWCIYGAREVGAPHKRERVFVIAKLANHDDGRHRPGPRQSQPRTRREGTPDHRPHDPTRLVAHPDAGLHQRAQRRAIPSTNGEDTGQSGHEAVQQCEDMANHDGERTSQRDRRADPQGSRANPGSEDTGQAQPPMGRDIDGISHQLDIPHGPATSAWPKGPGPEQHKWEPDRTIPAEQFEPGRRQRLMMLGNTVVPQQIYPILQMIVDYEERRRATS